MNLRIIKLKELNEMSDKFIDIKVIRAMSEFNESMYEDLVAMGEPGLAIDYLNLIQLYEFSYQRYMHARGRGLSSVHCLNDLVKDLYEIRRQYNNLVHFCKPSGSPEWIKS